MRGAYLTAVIADCSQLRFNAAMLNLHELNVFVEAAQAENFSIAAGRLFLSQPAVSLHIRNLEKRLGVTLFERHGRNIKLSEAGKLLLPMAQDLLRRDKQIEETMLGLQGKVIGRLIIACSTTVGKYILPRLVAGFRARYPDVAVEINVMSRRAGGGAPAGGPRRDRRRVHASHPSRSRIHAVPGRYGGAHRAARSSVGGRQNRRAGGPAHDALHHA